VYTHEHLAKVWLFYPIWTSKCVCLIWIIYMGYQIVFIPHFWLNTIIFIRLQR
jgi:hypothetical protein